ncbi:MAG TPA: LysE family transporter [Candidatus Cybelea sp.]|nr:LysE family transporter [Candidatus Cybelea sp.]
MALPSILIAVAALWLLAVVSPGPNFLVTARLSITRSRRDGLRAVGGIALGTIVWGGAGCFGIQALFLAAPWMYLTLKLLGAAYLVAMGVQLLWQSRTHAAETRLDSGRWPRISAFKLGLATTIANPRSAVSVASIFATTVPAHAPLAFSLAVIAVMVSISVSWYALVACLFTIGWLADGYRQARRWIDRTTGACLIFFGARLAVEQ